MMNQKDIKGVLVAKAAVYLDGYLKKVWSKFTKTTSPKLEGPSTSHSDDLSNLI